VKDGKNYTAIGNEVRTLLSQVSSKKAPSEFRYKNVDPEVLANTMVDATVLKSILEKSLKEYELLSVDSSYSRDRKGKATDGKWQVVVLPVDSLSVDDVQGIMKVP